jgi:hypothetical protein
VSQRDVFEGKRLGVLNVGGRALDVGLLIVIVAAVAVRLVFLSNDPPILLTTDSITYALPANHLANGQGFDLSLRRTPGYPLFLAGLGAIFGDDFHPVVYAQHLLGVATAGLTWLLGRLALGRLAGLLGGLAVALSGPQIIYEHYLMSESLFTFLLVVATLPLVAGLLRASGRLYLLAGLLFGLCALTRPVGQVFPLLVPVAVLLVGSPGVPRNSAGNERWRAISPRIRAAVTAGLLALLGFGMVVLPWMARNWLVGGELTGSSALGKTLFGRITRHDEGFRFDLPPAVAESDALRAQARAVARQAAQEDTSRGSLVHQQLMREFGYSEAQAYNVMRDAALEVLLAQPGYYLRSSLGGAVELFVGQEERLRVHLEKLATPRLRREWQEMPEVASLLPAPVPPELRTQTLSRSIWAVRLYQPSKSLPPVLVGVLFLTGTLVMVLRSGWRAALPLPLLVIGVIILSAFLDGPVPRFRYPLDPFISLTAAAGFIALIQMITRLVQRPTAKLEQAEGSGVPQPAFRRSPPLRQSNPEGSRPK